MRDPYAKWVRGRFELRSPSGARFTVRGRRDAVIRTLWEILPAWLRESRSHPDFYETLRRHLHAIRPQENVDVEERDAEPQKYIVGTVLTFQGYSKDEVETLGEDHKYTFRRGDRLVVVEKNGCGMGIDVRRLSDGVTDMVWREEVTVARDQSHLGGEG